MNNHKKQMVAPVIITVLMLIYYVRYFGLLITQVSGISRYLLAFIPLLLGGASIGVCIERIKEIEKGETDDIGKY